MSKSKHSAIRYASPPPRTFVLILSALAVMLAALLVSDLSDAPSAAAQTTTYDLCQRSTAVRHEILFALQYPNRDRGRDVTDNRYLNGQATGTNNNLSTYPQATWGTLDASNDNGVYTTDPCTTPGARLEISATRLGADASWGNWRRGMRLVDKNLDRLIPTDFVGLRWLRVIFLNGNNISEIPDRIFENTQTIVVRSERGNQGLAPDCDWFGSYGRYASEIAIWGTGITHADIAPDAFDNCFLGYQSSLGIASQFRKIKLRNLPELGHINLRWFEKLPNLDVIELNDSLVDTYFYADGPTGDATTTRYLTGAKTQKGATDVTASDSAANQALGAAIKAEIDRFWATTGITNPVTVPAQDADGANIATGVQRLAPGFNMCDPRDRSPAISSYIFEKFKDPDGDANTPAPAAYRSSGCGDGEVPYLTKQEAYDGFHWDTRRTPFAPDTGRLVELRKSDLKGLHVTGIRLTGTRITTLPDDIFEGSTIATFDARWMNNFQFDPKSWFGTSASIVTHLEVASTLVNHTDFTTFDYMDGFTSLRYLDMRNAELGYINTRWFDRLTSMDRLLLGGAYVAKYYYDADGNDPATTGNVDYWKFMDLQNAINTARTNAGTTRTINYSAWDGLTPPKVAVDICDRPKVIWAEIMRNFKYLEGDNDVGSTYTYALSGRYVTNVGDVRHARYAAVNQSACRPVPARAVVKSSLATVDPETTTFDASIHGKTIEKAGVNIGLRLQDTVGLGPRLNPDHFADLENAVSILLDRTGIEEIPDDTFAEAKNIRTLGLRGNSLDNADLEGDNFLQHFTQLRDLTLSDNLLTKFESSWLPAAMRRGATNPLRTLRLDNSAIKTVDVSGLDVTNLRLNNTKITSIDPSILDLPNLQQFWYQTATLRLDGLHPDGVAAFLRELPASITASLPHGYIGNELEIADEDLNAAALDFHQAHHARLRQINDADSGKDSINVVNLYDPCVGSSCLTEAQKNSFIDSLSSFKGLDWVNLWNSNLSSAQMARLLRSVDGQPMRRLNILSNPNAFGSGFDNSVFNLLSDPRWRMFWELRIVDSGLNFTQAQAIIANLREAYAPSRALDAEGNLRWTNEHLETIDFADNPDLFTGATTEQLSTWLTGVTPVGAGWGAFRLDLANTNLDYDKLNAILNSIEHFQAVPNNVVGLRSLDVSENPNLWNRQSGGSWSRVTLNEMRALLDRLQGVTYLNISDTGIEGAEFTTIMSALARNSRANDKIDPNSGVKSAGARMVSFGIADNDLGALDPNGLKTAFRRFGYRYPTAAPALRSLNLARTNIDCADLKSITDGLQTAGALSTLTSLNLDGNPDLFNNCPTTPPLPDGTEYMCDPTSASDPVVKVFGRYSHLRVVSIDETEADFNELQCVAEGLDASDGTEDEVATNVRTFSATDNENAFTVPKRGTVAAKAATPAAVATFFQQLPNASKVLTNSGLTVAQAEAALAVEQEGQTPEERRETARRFAAQNPAFTFKTPIPGDLKVESGRSSVRVVFTHDPKLNGADFTVLPYQYRYRVRPDDPSAGWGTSDSEKWRTATLKLDIRGPKSFVIYGLLPDTVYQVQLRAASSLGQPAIEVASGGTIINLPIIDKIEPGITEVSLRAGDSVRLEVDVYGRAGILDNTIPDKNANLVFDWSDSPSGGSFAEPEDQRRVVYTAPNQPGTYIVTVQAQPDGVCTDHHRENFDISDKYRAPCMKSITIRVSRAPTPPEPPADPINPAGLIPSSFTDSSGVAYSVFTPVAGGTFTGEGITVSAAEGAVPDRQLLGVSAAVSSESAPDPVPGARMTIATTLYDINGVQQDGASPVSDFKLDEPLMTCLPLPAEFSANISDIVLVQRKADGTYGILSTTLRHAIGDLSVCGSVSTLPATVGIAKLGVVPPPPVMPTPEVETPDTGATAPSNNMAAFALGLGIALVAVSIATAAAATAIRRRRSASDTAP